MTIPTIKCNACSSSFYGWKRLKAHYSIDHPTSDFFKVQIFSEEMCTELIRLHSEVYPISQIFDIAKITYPSIRRDDVEEYLFSVGFSKWTQSELKKGRPYIEKFATTLKERHGVENPSQIPSVKDKKRSTFISNYGVVNNFLRPELYEKVKEGYRLFIIDSVRVETANQRRSETLQDKYGPEVQNPVQIPGVKKVLSEKAKVRSSSKTKEELRLQTSEARKYWLDKKDWISKPELKVKKCLDVLRVKYLHQVFLYGYSFDFLVFPNVLIEVNGDYWHANPEKYVGTDLLKKGWHAKDIWDKDLKKKLTAESKGNKTITIWENIIVNSSEEELTALLEDLLINARPDSFNKTLLR